jgi:hypothetical protein
MTKKIVASLILPCIIFIGCGSDGGSNSKSDLTEPTSEIKSVDEVLKLSDVIYGAPQEIDFQNKTRMRLKRHKEIRNKLLKINSLHEKAEASSCSISGTVNTEILSNGSLTIIYNECINHSVKTGLSSYYDGKLQTNSKGNQILFYGLTEILDYENYPETGTYYDDIKMTFSVEDGIEEIQINGKLNVNEHGDVVESMNYADFTIKNNLINKSYYMAGNFADKMRCHTEEHNYQTKNNNWLVEDSTNSKKISSGTLQIDELKYNYQKENVVVTKNNQKGTFVQQELIDGYNEKKDQTECSVSYL